MTSNDYFSELLSDLCFTTAEDIINLCLTAKIYKQLLLRMGSAFYGIALLIIDSFDRNQKIGSIRFHDLDHLSYCKLVSLCNLHIASLIYSFCKSQIRIPLLIGIIVIDLCFLAWFAIKEASCKFTVSAACDLLLIPGHVCLIFGRIFQIIALR